jgi:pimeloyl-ACP methyl ester carboxylesterase
MSLGSTHKCQVDGFNIAYHRIGKGDPVLLVHGITTYSFIWDTLASILGKHYTVIVPDLLGCGESDKPMDIEYSLINHAAILHGFLQQLKIDKIHFVGHDVGGGIGQIFVVHYPEQLYDLTLVNTVAYDFWPVQPIIAMRTPILRQLAMATLDLGTFKLILRRAFHNKDKLTPEIFAMFSRQMESKEGKRAFLHFAKCLNNQHLLDIVDDLKKINLPVLIVRGEGDMYLSAKISEKLHEDIPGSKLERVPSSGHFIQEDTPDVLADILITFLKDHA